MVSVVFTFSWGMLIGAGISFFVVKKLDKKRLIRYVPFFVSFCGVFASIPKLFGNYPFSKIINNIFFFYPIVNMRSEGALEGFILSLIVFNGLLLLYKRGIK